MLTGRECLHIKNGLLRELNSPDIREDRRAVIEQTLETLAFLLAGVDEATLVDDIDDVMVVEGWV